MEPELDPLFGEQVYDLPGALAPLQEQLRLQADAEARDAEGGEVPAEQGEETGEPILEVEAVE
jgi:hypothetical protein